MNVARRKKLKHFQFIFKQQECQLLDTKLGILGGSNTVYNNNAVSGQTDKVVYNNYGLLKISKKFTCKICKPSKLFYFFVLHVYINDYQNLFYNDLC